MIVFGQCVRKVRLLKIRFAYQYMSFGKHDFPHVALIRGHSLALASRRRHTLATYADLGVDQGHESGFALASIWKALCDYAAINTTSKVDLEFMLEIRCRRDESLDHEMPCIAEPGSCVGLLSLSRALCPASMHREAPVVK